LIRKNTTPYSIRHTMEHTVNRTIELAKQLIRQKSVTPNDAGCQDIIIKRLSAIGMREERLRFGSVDNLWMRKGNVKPLLVFAGHTDVVPTGPEQQWSSPPFDPVIKDGYLYGRGAADMKGSIAAMTVACENFFSKNNQPNGSMAFLITSDEEGPAIDGTKKVIDTLEARGEKIDYCIVGEPTSSESIGDTIKNGRRGSLNANLLVKGIQGHIAYPQLAANPIHLIAPVLNELCTLEWDRGNEYFPSTCFQISNINAGTGATNVIPGSLEIIFNFRYSSSITHQQLQDRVESILEKHGIQYDIDWALSGAPFLTEKGLLTEAVNSAVKQVVGQYAQLSTSGGTSDGRFIAPTGAQVIELGPSNQTIHKINECVKVDDLITLTEIYEQILGNILV